MGLINMTDAVHLTATEAADALGVKVETLYAYVSRGLVRSEAGGGRARRYRAEDIEHLRRERQGDPSVVAAAALGFFGAPVLDSAITLIADGRLYYRGEDAARLAREASVRDVAALLWQADAERVFARNNLPSPGAAFAATDRAVAALAPIERCLALLPIVAAEDLRGLDLSAAAVAETGGRLLRLMTAIVAKTEASARPVDAVLADAWRVGAAARPIIRAALILSADHELNVSAFTARCVASARAGPYNAVIAGIAALQGARHGGESERADVFLGEALAASDPAALVAAHLRRGERLAGFGHPLYPDGDPRAPVLLEMLTAGDWPHVAAGQRVCDTVAALIGKRPNIDFALALLRRALALPAGAALALFALGRTMGWLAHAIEQYASDRLIRPRARYVGPPVAAGR
jgi:citrate synthase